MTQSKVVTAEEWVCSCWTTGTGNPLLIFRHNPECTMHRIATDPICVVCDRPIDIDGAGAGYDPDGRYIHPWGSGCHRAAWGHDGG